MQKWYKLLLTLNLIVALSQSQTRTKCIKITQGFPLAHSSLCFKCNHLQATLGAEWADYLDLCFTVSCLDLVLAWTYWDTERVVQRKVGETFIDKVLFVGSLADGTHWLKRYSYSQGIKRVRERMEQWKLSPVASQDGKQSYLPYGQRLLDVLSSAADISSSIISCTIS